MIFKRKQKKAPVTKQRIVTQSNEKRYLTDELEGILNGWRTGNTDIDSVINSYHSKLVARSREQHRKNDYVKRYFQLLRTNVIGADGVVFHAVMQDESGKRLVEHNTTLEQAWMRWQRKNTCDIAGKLDFIQMQQIILISVAQDGEALIRLIKDKTNPFGLSLQLVDIDKLDVNYNKRISSNRFIRNSIEFNEYGKPLAYHLLEEDEQGVLKTKKYQRIPADEIIHLYQTEFAGQKRGIPWVSTALFRLKMLDSYQDAAIVAPFYGSCHKPTLWKIV